MLYIFKFSLDDPPLTRWDDGTYNYLRGETYRMYIMRKELKERKTDYIKSLKGNTTLCKTVELFGLKLNSPWFSDGRLERLQTSEYGKPYYFWMLIRSTAPLPEPGFYPAVADAMALAVTREESKFCSLKYFCATERALRGDGKLLFDVIVSEAKTNGMEEIVLQRGEGAKKVYTRYGMNCDNPRGKFTCNMRLDDVVPREVVPNMVPVLLADPAEDMVSGAAAAKSGGRGTSRRRSRGTSRTRSQSRAKKAARRYSRSKSMGRRKREK